MCYSYECLWKCIIKLYRELNTFIFCISIICWRSWLLIEDYNCVTFRLLLV